MRNTLFRPAMMAAGFALAIATLTSCDSAPDEDEQLRRENEEIRTSVAQMAKTRSAANPTATGTLTPVRTPTAIPATSTPVPGGRSRSSPSAIGSAVLIGDWSITVDAVVPNGTQQVLAAIRFISPPAPGDQFFLVHVTATFLGSKEPAQLNDIQFKIVGSSAVAYDYQAECAVPDRIAEYRDVFRGGTLTGNLCWAVKSSDVGSLVMFGKQFLGDDVRWWSLTP